MGITERRQMEKEIIKKKIIDAANEILIEEGYEKLSIRKIANKIEYSPGIIYHYFKDKAEIVTCIVDEGYKNILECVGKEPIDIEEPEKTIENNLRSYIELMLKTPQRFKAILMSDIESVQQKVNILHKGVSKERSSIQGLCKVIELGIERGRFRDIDAELTAQIFWTSTHGLVSRLVMEKNISEQQKERLIDHHFKMLINGIMK